MSNLCILIFIIAFFYAVGVMSDGYIEHNPPEPFILARDALLYPQLSIDIIDNNRFVRSSYISAGSPSYYYRGPVMNAGIAFLSVFTGINEYDMGFFFLLFCQIAMILVMYLMISRYSKLLAVLSLPLTTIVFAMPFHMGLTWGRWLSLINIFYILLIVLLYLYMKFDAVFVMGALIGFSLLTHVKETLYFSVIAIPLFFVYEFFTKYLNLKTFGKLVSSYLVAFVVFSGFLSYAVFVAKMKSEYLMDFRPIDMGVVYNGRIDVPFWHSLEIFQWVILAGIVFSLLFFIFTRKKRNRGFDVVFLFSISYLIMTFIGRYLPQLREAMSQDRFFWPITLCMLSGMFFYSLYKLAIAKTNAKKWAVFLGLFVLALILVFTNFKFEKIPYYPVTEPNTWAAMQWIKQNTPEDSRFLMLYGDNLFIDALYWPSKRIFNGVDTTDYYKAATKGELQFRFKPQSHEAYVYQTGLFDFRMYNVFGNATEVSLCAYDYVYLNKISYYQVIHEYTLRTANYLIANKSFEVVYDNGYSVVMKNPNPKEEC